VGWAKRYHRLCWEDVSCRKVRQPIRQPLHRIVSVARMLPDWTKLERVHQNVWIDLVDRYDLDKDGGLGFTNGEFTLLISDLTRHGGLEVKNTLEEISASIGHTISSNFMGQAGASPESLFAAAHANVFQNLSPALKLLHEWISQQTSGCVEAAAWTQLVRRYDRDQDGELGFENGEFESFIRDLVQASGNDSLDKTAAIASYISSRPTFKGLTGATPEELFFAARTDVFESLTPALEAAFTSAVSEGGGRERKEGVGAGRGEDETEQGGDTSAQPTADGPSDLFGTPCLRPTNIAFSPTLRDSETKQELSDLCKVFGSIQEQLWHASQLALSKNAEPIADCGLCECTVNMLCIRVRTLQISICIYIHTSICIYIYHHVCMMYCVLRLCTCVY